MQEYNMSEARHVISHHVIVEPLKILNTKLLLLSQTSQLFYSISKIYFVRIIFYKIKKIF